MGSQRGCVDKELEGRLKWTAVALREQAGTDGVRKGLEWAYAPWERTGLRGVW